MRFRNDGRRNYQRAEAHLVYQVKGADPTRVTFAWTDQAGEHLDAHVCDKAEDQWLVPTGLGVTTRWVEFEPVF